MNELDRNVISFNGHLDWSQISIEFWFRNRQFRKLEKRTPQRKGCPSWFSLFGPFDSSSSSSSYCASFFLDFWSSVREWRTPPRETEREEQSRARPVTFSFPDSQRSREVIRVVCGWLWGGGGGLSGHQGSWDRRRRRQKKKETPVTRSMLCGEHNSLGSTSSTVHGVGFLGGGGGGGGRGEDTPQRKGSHPFPCRHRTKVETPVAGHDHESEPGWKKNVFFFGEKKIQCGQVDDTTSVQLRM